MVLVPTELRGDPGEPGMVGIPCPEGLGNGDPELGPVVEPFT